MSDDVPARRLGFVAEHGMNIRADAGSLTDWNGWTLDWSDGDEVVCLHGRYGHVVLEDVEALRGLLRALDYVTWGEIRAVFDVNRGAADLRDDKEWNY